MRSLGKCRPQRDRFSPADDPPVWHSPCIYDESDQTLLFRKVFAVNLK